MTTTEETERIKGILRQARAVVADLEDDPEGLDHDLRAVAFGSTVDLLAHQPVRSAKSIPAILREHI